MEDGVLSLISLRVYKIWNGSYSPDKCPLPTKIYSSACDSAPSSTFTVKDNNAQVEEIDLDECDRVLSSDYNSMYEVLNPTTDIWIKCKTR